MATLNYTYPVTGATAPTAAEMFGKSAVNVEVTTEMYDETISIAHNMALSAADLAEGWPVVVPHYTNAAAASSHFRYTNTDGNTISVSGLSPAAGTVRLQITRPTSLEK